MRNQLNAPGRDIHLPIGQKKCSFPRVDVPSARDEVKWRRIRWHYLLIVAFILAA